MKILKSRNPNGKEGSAHSTDVFKMDSSISREDLPETFRQRLLRTDQLITYSQYSRSPTFDLPSLSTTSSWRIALQNCEQRCFKEIENKSKSRQNLYHISIKKRNGKKRTRVEIENKQNKTCVISSEKQSRDHHCTYSAHGRSPSIHGSHRMLKKLGNHLGFF